MTNWQSALRIPVGESYVTPHEKKLLWLLRNGKTNKWMAAEIGVGEQQVKNKISELIHRFQVENRTQLAFKMARLGVIEI